MLAIEACREGITLDEKAKELEEALAKWEYYKPSVSGQTYPLQYFSNPPYFYISYG